MCVLSNFVFRNWEFKLSFNGRFDSAFFWSLLFLNLISTSVRIRKSEKWPLLAQQMRSTIRHFVTCAWSNSPRTKTHKFTLMAYSTIIGSCSCKRSAQIRALYGANCAAANWTLNKCTKYTQKAASIWKSKSRWPKFLN